MSGMPLYYIAQFHLFTVVLSNTGLVYSCTSTSGFAGVWWEVDMTRIGSSWSHVHRGATIVTTEVDFVVCFRLAAQYDQSYKGAAAPEADTQPAKSTAMLHGPGCCSHFPRATYHYRLPLTLPQLCLLPGQSLPAPQRKYQRVEPPDGIPHLLLQTSDLLPDS